MADLLIDLPVAVGLPLFIIFIMTLGTLIHRISYRTLSPHMDKGHERVGRVLFRTSASLLALLVSFTFANQRVDYFKLKNSLELEAAKIVDIYMDLDMYGGSEAELIKNKIRTYIAEISKDDWEAIHVNPFESELFKQFREIYADLHRLPEEGRFQEELKSNITTDVEEVSDYLQQRVYVASQTSSNLVYTSAVGFVIICILFSVYPPDKITDTFLGLYNGFIGFVLYLIIMMANPLEGPLRVKPEPFQLLQQTIESNQSTI